MDRPATSPCVAIDRLSFGYGGTPVLRELSLVLESGWRCLLVGANGAGKSTLLRVLSGRHLSRGVRVLGRDAFHDTTLVRDVVYVGPSFPVDVDLSVAEILAARRFNAERGARLRRVLGVEPGWRMHQVSDGQRRRVQLLLALLEPRRLVLLDEATADLDLIARLDVLALIAEDSARHQTTVLYATHVLEGLERWATHIAWLADGRIARFGPIDALAPPGAELRLAAVVEGWLRSG